MEILIDYLTFTDNAERLYFWKERLKLFDVQFIAGNARYGWQQHDYYSGLHIYCQGRDDICIEMSGIGCRFLESLHDNDFDWFRLLSDIVHTDSAHISRLDVACDDREEDKILTFSTLVKHCQVHKYISRSRRRVYSGGDEENIVFGSPQSDTRLRIYNKALERGNALGAPFDEHWIRAEFQFRDDAALSFILNLLQVGDIGETYSGVLLNYLRFTTQAPDENNNNSRLVTTKWWDKFLNCSQRIKNIKVGGLEYNYSTLEQFITKQCSSSLKTFVQLHHGDVTPLLEIIDKAEINVKQDALIKNMR